MIVILSLEREEGRGASELSRLALQLRIACRPADDDLQIGRRLEVRISSQSRST